MAEASGIRAGKAYVELGVHDRVTRGVQAIERRLKTMGETVSGFGTKMAAVGVGVVGAFLPAIKAASDLNESMSKFGVVFGSQAAAVKQWADTTAAEVGRSKKTIADFAARAQNLFIPLGIDPADAAEMSKTLTKLAVDLGSFNNVDDETAFQKLMSGMLGESEPLKAFGVIVNETAVKAELLNQRINPKGATDAQKAYARLAIIMRSTQAAQGDAVRTADGFANQLKRLQGEAYDAAAALGQAVLPIATKFISSVTGIVVKMSEWVQSHQSLVGGVGQLALQLAAGTAILGGALIVIGQLIAAGGTLIKVYTGVKVAMAFLYANPLGLVIAGAAAAVIGFTALTGHTAELSDEMRKLREEGDAQRSADQQRLETLGKLAAAGRLTADQQREAKGLIAALEERYGSLALNINTATGALEGFAQAQAFVSQQMKDNAVGQLQAELQEAQENLKELGDDRIAKQQAVDEGLLGLGDITSGDFSGRGKRGELRDATRKFEEQRKTVAEIAKRLQEAQAGNVQAITGESSTSPASTAAGTADDVDKLRERLEELRKAQQKDLAGSWLSDTAREIQDVNESLREQLAIIQKLIDAEPADADGLDSQAVQALVEQRVEAERRAQAQIDDINRKAGDKKAKEQRARSIDENDFFLEQAKELAELTGDKAGAKQAAADLRASAFERQIQDLFGDDEAKKSKARAAQKQVEDARANQKTFSSAGLFNSAAIQSLQGSSVQDKIAKNTEDTAKHTREIAKKKGPAFG